MMECDAVRQLSTAWADEQLTTSDRARVDAHLGRCSPCRAELNAERTARTIVRNCQTLTTAPQPSPLLRTRCEQAIRHSTVRARRRSRVALVAAAAATLVISGYSLRVLTDRSTTVLAAQLATDHVKCHLITDASKPVDSGVVQRRLLVEYGFETPVPPSSPAQKFRLLGARRCLTGEGTNAHILYELDGRPVSVYLLPRHTRASGEVDVLGQRAYVWSRDNGTYVLIANKNVADLPEIVKYVQSSTR